MFGLKELDRCKYHPLREISEDEPCKECQLEAWEDMRYEEDEDDYGV